MLNRYMKSLGYNDKEMDRIKNAYIFRKYTEMGLYNKISDIFNYLLMYGYTNEEIIKISVTFPTIYAFSIDSIKERINDFIELGYTKEEMIKITTKMPSLFGRNIDDIRIKKRFYDQIDIGDIIVKAPIHFSQSIELSFARYVFYYRMGIKIDRGNANMLFMRQDLFISKFGKTNEQLMILYNYNEYLEKKKAKSKKK